MSKARKRFDGSLSNGTISTVAVTSSKTDRAAAVRAVCAMAGDAVEAAEVLEMLGLDPAEGRTTTNEER